MNHLLMKPPAQKSTRSKRLKLNLKKLSEEEKKRRKKIAQKSDLVKNPNQQRRREQENNKYEFKRRIVIMIELSTFKKILEENGERLPFRFLRACAHKF